MMAPRAATAIWLVIAAALPATASCSRVCHGFAASLASDRGGQATPVAAAEWAGAHGDYGIPRSGWHQDGKDDGGVILRSGNWTVHAGQGPDGTWQVASGTTC